MHIESGGNSKLNIIACSLLSDKVPAGTNYT